ncbi:MAG: Abi family protein [Spirochaetales bacterium]|nr:Abi family protein [Spirochaetales bacterium]
MDITRELKQPLDIPSQIERLKQHNLIIEDEEKARRTLEKLNYYRFTGYALQFRYSENNSDLMTGTTFGMVQRIYEFDEDLRSFLRKYIEKAEILYRTLIAYHFSLAKCKNPPYDQHYDERNFFNKKGYQELRNHFMRDRDYYKDSLILKHHKKHYNDKLPLWAIVELISFSDLSKLYNCMYYSEKNLIATAARTNHAVLANNLHCLSVLRNKCAHAARLYNTTFNPPAIVSHNFLKKYPAVRNDTLFAYLIMLSRRLTDQDLQNPFVSGIIELVESYSSDIDLDLIGFPANWKDILKWVALP